MPLIARTLVALSLLLALPATAAPHRRAVIVGINDYSASKIAGWNHATPPGRDYPSLRAAVNDADAMHELLVLFHGFDARDVVVLRNQEATRAGILRAIDEQLVKPAAQGDVVFFYFAGHGSHVRNSRSDEPDRMDETLVPADARAGAADIRDKELRARFNRILDRGARLTVMLDNCFSGSGARGLPVDAQVRGIRPDPRDIADATQYGPRPENRGALVLAASQDDGSAYETNERGVVHGTFTWAWLHAVRDGAPGESATETFLRAQARTRAARPYQQPVLAGTESVREAPFLGERIAARSKPRTIAVEKVQRDGTLILQGGWANGLGIGSTLRLAAAPSARITITAMLGLARSEARLEPGTAMPAALQSGALLEPAGFTVPQGRPLRLGIARTNVSARELERLARTLHDAATQRGVRWLRDPIDETPSHVLRRGGSGWELVHAGRTESVADPRAAIATLPSRAKLFVQLPVPSTIGDGLEADAAAGAPDYLLAGRYADGRVTYAWLPPAVTSDDRRRSALPLRSAWTAAPSELRTSLDRIRKVFAWQTLESPAGGAFPYRLALRRERDGAIVRAGTLRGGDGYRLLLSKATPRAEVQRRFVYVFAIDRDGRGILLFPSSGSVENHFPLAADAPPREIPLARIRIGEPYGLDTYFLLTSNDELPDPWILTWDGVRSPAPSAWSLEKISFESVPPVAESASGPTRSDLSCLPNRRSENRSRARLSSAATTTSSAAPSAASSRRTAAASTPSSKARARTTSSSASKARRSSPAASARTFSSSRTRASTSGPRSARRANSSSFPSAR